MWKLACERGRQVWEYVSNNKEVTEANYVPPAESKLFDKSQNAVLDGAYLLADLAVVFAVIASIC